MGEAAVKAARAAQYANAGTVEFVLDANGNFYFIEMNTRIQVEHPVTEMVTGVDLVRQQIRIAAGLPLPLDTAAGDLFRPRHRVPHSGCETRLRDSVPCPGTISFLHLPGGCGVRIDTAPYNGYETSPFYDSMIAKVIVHAPTRLDAIRRMRRVLEEMVIDRHRDQRRLCPSDPIPPRIHQGLL